MVKITFTEKGAKKAERMFRRLGGQEQKKVMKKALKDAAKIILVQAKENAPSKTGALKKSLKVRTIRSRVRIGSKVVPVQGLEDEDYTFAQQWGTRITPATHYLSDALETKRAKAIAVIARGFVKGVDEALRAKV